MQQRGDALNEFVSVWNVFTKYIPEFGCVVGKEVSLVGLWIKPANNVTWADPY